MKLATKLRLARESSGLTQSAISSVSGIAVPNLSKIENGKVDARLSTLDRLLDALGLEIQLVPRTSRVSLETVSEWSELGRSRLAATGLGASSPQARVSAKRNRGVDVGVEQGLLNAGD